jgi:hypothetical protein
MGAPGWPLRPQWFVKNVARALEASCGPRLHLADEPLAAPILLTTLDRVVVVLCRRPRAALTFEVSAFRTAEPGE